MCTIFVPSSEARLILHTIPHCIILQPLSSFSNLSCPLPHSTWCDCVMVGRQMYICHPKLSPSPPPPPSLLFDVSYSTTEKRIHPILVCSSSSSSSSPRPPVVTLLSLSVTSPHSFSFFRPFTAGIKIRDLIKRLNS